MRRAYGAVIGLAGCLHGCLKVEAPADPASDPGGSGGATGQGTSTTTTGPTTMPPAPAPGGDNPAGAGPGPGAGAVGGGDAGRPGKTCPAQHDVHVVVSVVEHLPACAPVSYPTRPPSSGAHYPSAPQFKVYRSPVPWGFLVHALEHGAVVIAHNCGEGCEDELADAEEMIAAWPAKQACPRPPIILVPDPTSPDRFAAAAWGHTLRATCFDRQKFAQFIAERANRAPESAANDCGELDLERTGWCPPPASVTAP
jgi:hypothetical protein